MKKFIHFIREDSMAARTVQQVLYEAKPREKAVSGQASERNLVNVINDNPGFKIRLGGQTHTITGARQLGGGNPEPKADIAITTSTGKDIGISMKKPNFAFFENWMDEKKLRSLLSSVNIEDVDQDKLVNELKKEAKDLTTSAVFKNEVKKEYERMMELLPPNESEKIKKTLKDGNRFKVSNLSISSAQRNIIKDVLLKDPNKNFGTSAISSRYKIPNIYKSMKELLGSNYNIFLKNIIGGSKDNPYPAEYVLVETVPPKISTEKIISILQKMKTVDDTVRDYSSDDNVNLKFRLRPMTITRAAYSSTNMGKFKKGGSFWFDDIIGVSWTVFVIK